MYSIYLDEFCWITLRDIASNKASVKQLRPLLELCKEKTSVSEWIFPLSFWHLIETQNTYNDKNRMLLGEIQAALSRGWRLTTFPQIKAIELKAYMKDKSHCVNMSEIISRNPVLSDIEIGDIISENKQEKQEAINCLKQIYCLVGGFSWSFTKQSECYVPFAETKERQLEYVQYLSEQKRLHGYSLYYRVVVFSDPLQGHVLHCKGCCGSVCTSYRKTVLERLRPQPLAVLLIS